MQLLARLSNRYGEAKGYLDNALATCDQMSSVGELEMFQAQHKADCHVHGQAQECIRRVKKYREITVSFRSIEQESDCSLNAPQMTMMKVLEESHEITDKKVSSLKDPGFEWPTGENFDIATDLHEHNDPGDKEDVNGNGQQELSQAIIRESSQRS